MPGPMRGQQFDAITGFAPILFGIIFLIVAVALVRNWIDARKYPDRQSQAQIDVRRLRSGSVRQMLIAGAQTKDDTVYSTEPPPRKRSIYQNH